MVDPVNPSAPPTFGHSRARNQLQIGNTSMNVEMQNNTKHKVSGYIRLNNNKASMEQ